MRSRLPGRDRAVLPSGPKEPLAEREAMERHQDVFCVVAGVPCQDWSIAGKREGIKGKRSGLVYQFARILQELRPDWFVFENVPGLLSANDGRDFAEVLRLLMVECGYGIQWRVLNSQFFGVAQRRRRLFIVGRFGRVCPAEVLFDSEGGDGNFAESGEEEADIAVPLTASASDSKPGRRQCDDFNIIASTLNAKYSEKAYRGDGSENIVAQAMSAKWAKGTSGPAGDEHHNLVAMPITGHHSWRGEDRDTYVGFTLPSAHRGVGQGHNTNYVSAPVDADGVRDFAGLPAGLDSPRYRALGNAVTVQVAEWIARRILALND